MHDQFLLLVVVALPVIVVRVEKVVVYRVIIPMHQTEQPMLHMEQVYKHHQTTVTTVPLKQVLH